MHYLITAGPTREAIDPVRYLSNRSSGRMGYAIAEAARAAGHEVTLISGPVAIPAPPGVHLVKVESAAEMFTATEQQLPSAQIAVFAAAVADYRPAAVEPQKLKKSAATLTLTLERTEDILGSVRTVFAWSGLLVGFAAETENLVAHAMGKLQRKGCDFLVANDVGRKDIGFEVSENQITLCRADGTWETWEKCSKSELAERLVKTWDTAFHKQMR